VTTVTGGGPAEAKILAAKLRAAPAEMKRDLRRQLRGQAGPAVRAAKESILSMPSHHDGTLRGEVARTVSSSVGLSARGARLDIVSSGRKMPAGKDRLPGFLDSAKGWNHPVWGNRDAWVREHGKPGWFEVPLAKRAPELRAAAERAIDDVKRKLS